MRIKARTKPGASFAVTGVLKMIAHRESSAKAPVIVLTVSQPKRLHKATTAGPMFPRTPKMARDKPSDGAPPRRPATEIMPTRAKDPNDPIAVTSTDCQTFKPNEMSVAPSGMPKMEILAANHTQKS